HGSGDEQVRTWEKEHAGAEEWAAAVERAPLERELELAIKGAAPLGVGELNQRIVALETWLPIAGSFRRFFAFGPKGAATAILSPLGLQRDPASTQRALDFYRGLRAR